MFDDENEPTYDIGLPADSPFRSDAPDQDEPTYDIGLPADSPFRHRTAIELAAEDLQRELKKLDRRAARRRRRQERQQ